MNCGRPLVSIVLKHGIAAMLFVTCGSIVAAQEQVDPPSDNAWESPVGMPVNLKSIVIPGPELQPRPITEKSAVVLRIERTYPHGSDFRYDLEARGLEPGRFNLLDYLQTASGDPAPTTDPVWLTAIPVLPSDQQQPNALTIRDAPTMGGYGIALWVGGFLWFVGLIAILVSIFSKRVVTEKASVAPMSLADQLRSLIDQAISDQPSPSAMARIEMLLLAYWREKLEWEDLDAHVALQRLHEHPEAGTTLRQIEDWLHRPEPVTPVDWQQVLEPYRHVAARKEALE